MHHGSEQLSKVHQILLFCWSSRESHLDPSIWYFWVMRECTRLKIKGIPVEDICTFVSKLFTGIFFFFWFPIKSQIQSSLYEYRPILNLRVTLRHLYLVTVSETLLLTVAYSVETVSQGSRKIKTLLSGTEYCPSTVGIVSPTVYRHLHGLKNRKKVKQIYHYVISRLNYSSEVSLETDDK